MRFVFLWSLHQLFDIVEIQSYLAIKRSFGNNPLNWVVQQVNIFVQSGEVITFILALSNSIAFVVDDADNLQTPPPQNSFKLNSDAPVFEDNVVQEAILRNHMGEVLMTYDKFNVLSGSMELAEIIVLHDDILTSIDADIHLH